MDAWEANSEVTQENVEKLRWAFPLQDPLSSKRNLHLQSICGCFLFSDTFLAALYQSFCFGGREDGNVAIPVEEFDIL